MKKIISGLILFFVFLAPVVNAQVLDKATENIEDIQNLKDKIASKVAELRDKSERAYAGEILEVGRDSIKIKAPDNKNYQIKIDNTITNIYQIAGTSKKEVGFKNLVKGDYVIATGPINGSIVSANYVYLDEQFITGAGKVTEVNSSENYIRVFGVDNETYTLDIETSSKRQLLDIKSLELEATTLAKVKEGDTLHFVVSKTGKEVEKNRYSAEKIMVIPQEFFQK